MQYITEGSGFEKGWAHKSGKMLIHRGMRPYHVQQLVNNLSKFGIKKADVMNILVKRYKDKFDAPDPLKVAKSALVDLESGEDDIDHEIEWLVIKKGWCRVVLDSPYPSIGGKDLKTIHAVAKKLTSKYPKVFGYEMTSAELSIHSARSMGGVGEPSKRYHIKGSYDWKQWLSKGGDPDRIGAGRTEIGATMAMFRDHVKPSEKYLADGSPLMGLMKRHDDPLTFAHAATVAQRNKQLKLKPRGAANTRELIAAWKKRKARKA